MRPCLPTNYVVEPVILLDLDVTDPLVIHRVCSERELTVAPCTADGRPLTRVDVTDQGYLYYTDAFLRLNATNPPTAPTFQEPDYTRFRSRTYWLTWTPGGHDLNLAVPVLTVLELDRSVTDGPFVRIPAVSNVPCISREIVNPCTTTRMDNVVYTQKQYTVPMMQRTFPTEAAAMAAVLEVLHNTR